MKKDIFSLIFLLLISASCFAQFGLRGKVLDENGQGIYNVEIRVNNQQLITSDADGNFELLNLKDESVRLECFHLGYKSIAQEFNLMEDVEIEVFMEAADYLLEEINIASTWAEEGSPIAKTNILKEELQLNNLGQDVPFLLDQTPSVVVSSDAGAGIGYTGIRIRGSDQSRINVSINGIPLNDSESQGVFWVDLPDFASSVDQIQIQRGVGTSTNGAGAFGATINLKTNAYKEQAGGRLENTIGSYNTRKHTINVNSGLINGRWAIEARLSDLQSDGYIDRAASDLNSYYLSASYVTDQSILKAIHFSGHEITYQSWYGTPQSRIEGDEDAMRIHALNNGLSPSQTNNLLTSGRTYNFYEYDRQVDDYQQDHYQLHFNHKFSDKFRLNSALHFTHGFGYFEQFREDDDFSDYGLPNPMINGLEIEEGDFIRRRWLDNDFYGVTFNLKQENTKWTHTLGGAFNIYQGDHFGEIIWAEFASDLNIRDRYYFNDAEKTDANIFVKSNWKINDKINLFADIQFRTIGYIGQGISSDLTNINLDETFSFLNPKFGVNFQLSPQTRAFASFSRANREPVRSDFIDAISGEKPKSESMNDYEIGFSSRYNNLHFEVNGYFMDYQNQLVLTGALNDVGSPIRSNVDKSYRAGLEFILDYTFSKHFSLSGNIALSQNKIKQFNELVYDYTNGFDIIQNEFNDSDISFSPSVVSGFSFTYKPMDDLSLQWRGKYVGRQFLDNTSNPNRQIDAFFVNDIMAAYNVNIKGFSKLEFRLKVNNVLNELYSANGYTFNYKFGDLIVENFYYPQAERNLLFALNLDF